MQDIRFLEHKADELFEASGASFEEALENAAHAMFGVIAETEKIKPKAKIVVEARAESLEELAVFCLSELLSQSEAKGLFLKEFKVADFEKENSSFRVRGVASGDRMKPELGKTHVKAVTHHEARVKQLKNKWVVRILLDV